MDLTLCVIFICCFLVGISVPFYSAVLARLYRVLALKTPTAADGLPAVSVLLPIRGGDPEIEQNLRSLVSQDYPDFEIVAAFDGADDPVLPVAREVASESDGRLTICVGDGSASGGRNPKFGNLRQAYQAAQHSVLVHVDANVVFEPDRLRRTILGLGPGTALVTTTIVGIRPANFAGHVECAFLNGYHARFMLAAAALRIPYAMGKLVAYRRADLEQAGGIKLLADDIADDAALARAVRKTGGRLRFDPDLLEQPVGSRRWRDVWDRQKRWLMVRRGLVPFFFLSEMMVSAIVVACVSVGAGLCLGIAPVVVLAGWAALWYGIEAVFLWINRWPLQPMAPLAWILRDLMLPLLWISSLLSRRAQWRGQQVEFSGPSQRRGR